MDNSQVDYHKKGINDKRLIPATPVKYARSTKSVKYWYPTLKNVDSITKYMVEYPNGKYMTTLSNKDLNRITRIYNIEYPSK
jgi:hypothetical protein